MTLDISPGYASVSVVLSLGIVLSTLFTGALPLQEDTEKGAAMEKIRTLMDGGEWREAAKKLKFYLRKYAETEEEKESVSALLALAEGSRELDAIEKRYREKEQPRRATRDLTKLLKKYAEIPELVERALDLRELTRSQYVLVIQDFEESKDEEDGTPWGNFITRETDPKLVKHGESAGRWKNDYSGTTATTFKSPQEDWSGHDFFCMWIHNEKRGKRPIHMRIEATSSASHRFSYFQALDWLGWKEIRMPMNGKKSKFGRYGKPSWNTITYIAIYINDEPGKTSEIIMDDIHLEKAVK